MNMIERVARAINDARQKRPYGLYDYSGYPGNTPPHQVKDERVFPNKIILVTVHPEEAQDLYNKLSAEFIARAAIEVMREVPETCYGDYKCDKRWRFLNSKDVWNLWIDAALKE